MCHRSTGANASEAGRFLSKRGRHGRFRPYPRLLEIEENRRPSHGYARRPERSETEIDYTLLHASVCSDFTLPRGGWYSAALEKLLGKKLRSRSCVTNITQLGYKLRLHCPQRERSGITLQKIGVGHGWDFGRWSQERRFDQRAFAAFLADSRRCSAVIFLALAGPPFLPPRLPSSTACGSFGFRGSIQANFHSGTE
jgi:hypothetical protein